MKRSTPNQCSNTAESASWYRHPMVWMVIMLPALVVVASIYTVVIAHQNAPELLPLLPADKPAASVNPVRD